MTTVLHAPVHANDAIEPLPAPAGLPTGPVPVPGNADAFQAGLADRQHWEDWFDRQIGDARAGALWWTAERSQPNPASCRGSAAFVSGCLDAKAILTPTDSRRRAEADYRRGWHSYAAETGPSSPPPSASAENRLTAHEDQAAWTEGLRDRTGWEAWFAGLNGDRRAGALYWAGERSEPSPGNCNAGSDDFSSGCLEAQQRLAEPDRRRHVEAGYWRGWNSYGRPNGEEPTRQTAARANPTPTQRGTAPSPTEGQAGEGECAQFGTLGRLCTGQTDADVTAAFGEPSARMRHRCDAGTPDERECLAWYYLHDCGQYIILFEQVLGGHWHITSAGFKKPGSAAETAQWCATSG